MKFTISQRNLEVKVFILDLRKVLGQEILRSGTRVNGGCRNGRSPQKFQVISALDP
jgi:hypothetical protein